MTNPSWQRDPSGRHELRWWDGQRWTDHVNDHGLTSTDPLQAMAAPTHATPLQPPTVQQPTVAQPAYPPTVAQPTVAQPTYPAQAAPGAQQWSAAPVAPPPNRTPLIIAGVVAVLAIGVGAFFLLKGDDTPAADTTATTIPETTGVPDTTAPIESTTTVPTTSPGPVVSGALLVAMLPTDADVPSDWTRFAEADPAPASQSGPGLGYCGLSNAVGRAQLAGSTAQAYGPGWDLPDQTWFTLDVFAFPDTDSASSFLSAVLNDANSCAANPVNYTTTEAEAQWFTDDGSLDSTEWSVEERSGATVTADTKAAEAVQAFVDEQFTTTLSGTDYSVTNSTITLYERWGTYVLTFTLHGRWGYTGWSEPSEYEHQPTLSETTTAAAIVRDGLLKRLAAAGLI